MSIRTVCFILAVIVPGLVFHLVFGIAALVLPYIAVVLANAGSPAGNDVLRPTPIVPALTAGSSQTPHD